jgi:hypothetical protein
MQKDFTPWCSKKGKIAEYADETLTKPQKFCEMGVRVSTARFCVMLHAATKTAGFEPLHQQSAKSACLLRGGCPTLPSSKQGVTT